MVVSAPKYRTKPPFTDC